MRVVVLVGAVLAMAAASAQAQGTHDAPVCNAERQGGDLITRLEYPDGYTVEGPWHVTVDERTGVAAMWIAVLDHIIETRPFSPDRRSTPLPSAVQMTFRGNTQDELLDQAAHVWCMTVLKARPPSSATERGLSAPRIVM